MEAAMEVWDLYDKNRKKLNVTMLRGKEVPAGCYRIVVHLAIFNSEGQLLIQKRQSDKKDWPSRWDLSVGGSVVCGENSEMAMKRETAEELGLELDIDDFRPTITIHFSCGFDDIYIVEKDIDIDSLNLQSEEVVEVKWASKAEVLELLENEQFVPYKSSLINLIFELKKGEWAWR